MMFTVFIICNVERRRLEAMNLLELGSEGNIQEQHEGHKNTYLIFAGFSRAKAQCHKLGIKKLKQEYKKDTVTISENGRSGK